MSDSSRQTEYSSRLYRYHVEWLRSKKSSAERAIDKLDRRINKLTTSIGHLPVIHVEALLIKRQKVSHSILLYTDMIVHFSSLARKLAKRHQ